MKASRLAARLATLGVTAPAEVRVAAMSAVLAEVPAEASLFITCVRAPDGTPMYANGAPGGNDAELRGWLASHMRGPAYGAGWLPNRPDAKSRATLDTFVRTASVSSAREHRLTQVNRVVFEPMEVRDQLRAVMTDGPRLLGWVGFLRRGATARFSDAEEALVRRVYEPFKASIMAANALEDGQLQAGACAVLRPDGAVEHASGPFAAWLDPFRQGALARWVQALDRGEGSSATVIDRAEVRIVRLDATGSVRYLATLGAAAGARVDLAGPLSARQREVAEAAARSATVEEIARDLGISPHTAKTHLKQVYERLGVATRVELARALADRDR